MPKSTLTTVDKALSLLQHFTVQHPQIGLSELARLSGYDKTTTLRCLGALTQHGFVEQDSQSKRYRLGLAPINLARIRERSFPLLSVLQPHVEKLRDLTQETAHATMLSSGRLITALISEPERAARVNIDPASDLPLHATATGLAIAAHLPRSERDVLVAAGGFERYTASTPVSPDDLDELFDQTRQNGFARANQSYEDDVYGTAVPFFGPTGRPAGAVAVAAVASRFDATLARTIETALINTGQALTTAFGGTPPALNPSTPHLERTS